MGYCSRSPHSPPTMRSCAAPSAQQALFWAKPSVVQNHPAQPLRIRGISHTPVCSDSHPVHACFFAHTPTHPKPTMRTLVVFPLLSFGSLRSRPYLSPPAALLTQSPRLPSSTFSKCQTGRRQYPHIILPTQRAVVLLRRRHQTSLDEDARVRDQIGHPHHPTNAGNRMSVGTPTSLRLVGSLWLELWSWPVRTMT